MLRVERRSVSLRDWIGPYTAPALVIDLYGRTAEAVPVAWDAAASMAAAQQLGGPSEGLVDLTDACCDEHPRGRLAALGVNPGPDDPLPPG